MWSSSISHKHSYVFYILKSSKWKSHDHKFEKDWMKNKRINNIYLPWNKARQYNYFQRYEFLKFIPLFLRPILWIVEADASLNKWAYVYLIGLYFNSNCSIRQKNLSQNWLLVTIQYFSPIYRNPNQVISCVLSDDWRRFKKMQPKRIISIVGFSLSFNLQISHLKKNDGNNCKDKTIEKW